MTIFSIAAARDHFSALVERVEAGEDVVITRHGRPVVAMKAIRPDPDSAGAALDWLRSNRGTDYAATDAATIVTAMREEDWR